MASSASEAKRVDGGGEKQSDELVQSCPWKPGSMPGRASILVAAESGMIVDLAVYDFDEKKADFFPMEVVELAGGRGAAALGSGCRSSKQATSTSQVDEAGSVVNAAGFVEVVNSAGVEVSADYVTEGLECPG